MVLLWDARASQKKPVCKEENAKLTFAAMEAIRNAQSHGAQVQLDLTAYEITPTNLGNLLPIGSAPVVLTYADAAGQHRNIFQMK